MRRYFCQNGYPVKLVEKQIGTKLTSNSPSIKPDTVPKQEVYVKIPFIHDSASETLDSSLQNLVGINQFIHHFSKQKFSWQFFQLQG